MNMKQIIDQARLGRPDLAVRNAGRYGRILLALYCAKFPHSSGEVIPTWRAKRMALRAFAEYRLGTW